MFDFTLGLQGARRHGQEARQHVETALREPFLDDVAKSAEQTLEQAWRADLSQIAPQRGQHAPVHWPYFT